MPMDSIASVIVGFNEIMGTQHPVQHVAYRNGPRQYVVAWALCNGVPADSTTYRTRREALAALHAAAAEEFSPDIHG